MSASVPWWLREGDQQCVSCQHHFHYEAGYFCVHCDGPLCPLCVRYRLRTEEVICGGCEPQADEASK